MNLKKNRGHWPLLVDPVTAFSPRASLQAADSEEFRFACGENTCKILLEPSYQSLPSVDDLAQTRVDALDRFDRVCHPANLRREGKERDHVALG